MGKCIFNKDWPRKYTWARETSDKSKAFCWACRKEIDIVKMGESALRSHAKAESHKNNEKSMSVSFVNWFIKEESKQVTPPTSSFAQYSVASLTVPPPPPTPSTSGRAIASSTVSNYVSKNEVLKAEIILTMRTIMKHESYKSNENINNIFQSMFPDSEIARKFTLGERKTSYICVFGLADHFKSLLIEKIKGPFVALFDESLNKKMKFFKSKTYFNE